MMVAKGSVSWVATVFPNNTIIPTSEPYLTFYTFRPVRHFTASMWLSFSAYATVIYYVLLDALSYLYQYYSFAFYTTSKLLNLNTFLIFKLEV